MVPTEQILLFSGRHWKTTKNEIPLQSFWATDFHLNEKTTILWSTTVWATESTEIFSGFLEATK